MCLQLHVVYYISVVLVYVCMCSKVSSSIARGGGCELAGDGGAGYCQSRILFVSGIMGCRADQVLCLFGIMGCRADQVLFALGCIVVGVCGCCLCKCRVCDRVRVCGTPLGALVHSSLITRHQLTTGVFIPCTCIV